MIRERRASGNEIRDGMQIDWDAPIPMDDGIVLRADVFRPIEEGRYPVLLTCGPYAKGLAFQDGYPDAWETMVREHPDVAAGSSNLYQNWEVVDPEKWVPHGYVCVRVDSRGCGRSPGYVDPFSPRETRDFAACIEWAGEQPWSSGKVGLNGISYYAINQWQVASLQPPHLAAICVWEGAAEWYRDTSHHGGIYCTFWANWYDMQVKTVQHGLGERGPRSRVTGELVVRAGDLQRCAAGRTTGVNFGADLLAHPLDDEVQQEPLARLVQGDGAAALCGELGRPGTASARQFRGLHARRLGAKVARGARDRALDAFLYGLRPRTAEALLRPFFEGRKKWLGPRAARAAAGPPCRPLRRARSKTNGRWRARNGRNSILISRAAR